MADLYRGRFSATPQAVPAARREVLAALTQAGLTDAELHARVALAVSEATGNAVRHAYPPDQADGHVEVAVTRAGDTVIITVSDEGLGMDSHTSAEGSGLGLLLMRDQTQDLAVESDGNGTRVALHFSV